MSKESAFLVVMLIVSIVLNLITYAHRVELDLLFARARFPAGSAPHRTDGLNFVRGLLHSVHVGTISLGDNSEAAYWFVSHHQTGGISRALFELSDGSLMYIEGTFCCEVHFDSADVLTSQATLVRELRRIDARVTGN